MRNRDGGFVAPSDDTFAAASAGSDWSSALGFGISLVNQAGGKAWPITGATFILVHRQQADAAKGRAVLSFFDWAYKNGDQGAAQLDYVPLPAAVKDLVRSQWANVKGPDGQPVYTGS